MNDPVESVLVVPLRLTVDPANFTVRTELAAKPEPETITVEPTSPLVGLRDIDGVMANVAIAEFEFASDALTIFPPAV